MERVKVRERAEQVDRVRARWAEPARGVRAHGVVACAAALGVLVGGCLTTGKVSPGQDGPAPVDRCAEPAAPEGCGRSCTGDFLCGAGLHCAGGVCTAECWDGRACADAALACDGRGRCVDPAALVDAGVDGRVPDGGDVCGQISVVLDAVVPNVTFILDRSGSMDEPFRDSGRDRWDVLGDALFRPADPGDPADRGGIVYELHERVRFGLALYTWDADPGQAPECPWIVDQPILLSNYAAMKAVYDANDPPSDGETPTGESVRAVLAALEPGLEGPVVFVLATDGDPDRCEAPDGHDRQSKALSVQALEEAHDAGVPTYVISLGPVEARHIQDLANAGQGLPVKPPGESYGPTDPLADAYDPASDVGLREALSEIVRGALSCVLDVDGELVPERACEGTLLVDGVEVPCDAPGSGWRANDATHLEVLGTLCEDLLAGRVERIEGQFPCDVVLR